MGDFQSEQFTVPAVASSFVGRAVELTRIERLIGQERLVTVVGPGGSGKTRLVSEVLRSGSFGVHGFVELAPVRSGAVVADAVLAGCGIRDEPGRGPLDRLRDRLGRAEGVLVLDNCEQIRVEIAALVTDLLRGCAGLTVVATSRVTLGVAGETVLGIGGLDIDEDAVELFLDRARRVQPALPCGPDTDAAARRICRLADGLPLAIELAAARARALTLPAVEAGMADRLRFLTARDPGVVPQHNSLLASIEWSVALVDARARQVLAALSMFGGRFTLEAAVAVAGPGGREVVETLVDHCMVQFDVGDGRYLLLDTIRDYAGTELAAAGGSAPARLLGWVARLARTVGPRLDLGEAESLARVERDDAAVRSALAYALRAGTDLDAAAGIVVDLAFAWSLRGRCAEGRDWAARIGAVLDPPSPALAWAEALFTVYAGDLEAGFGLAAAAAEHAAGVGDLRIRGRALTLVGMVQMFVDPVGAQPVLVDAVAVAETAHDDWGHVEALQTLACAHLFRTDHEAALRCADAALPALQRLGHDQLRAWDCAIRADVAAQTGHFVDACTHGRAGLDIAVGFGEPVSANGALLPLVRALCQLGRAGEAAAVVAAHRPFLDSHPGLGAVEVIALAAAITASWTAPAAVAVDRIEPALAQAAAAGVASLAGEAAALLAVARLGAGNPEGAAAAAAEALSWAGAIGNQEVACAATLVRCAAERALGKGSSDDTHRALADAAAAGLRPLIPDALDLVAGHSLDTGRGAVAARLHTASTRARGELGASRSPLARLLREADEPAVATALGPTELSVASEEGTRLALGEAVAYASRSRGRRARPRAGWDSLTPTERDVTALASRGLSNPAIASQLLIAPGTVRTHLRSVFGKLGVSSRAELAAEATRRGL